jgi:ubiquinone/menaquinone biosynthesis C-methylase UbiE
VSDKAPDEYSTQRLNSLAAKGFNDGERYNAARPSYPIAALEYFVAKFDLGPSVRALDLGAGTGIFTRQILPYVGRVTAVDPSSSMRAALEASGADVNVVEGSDVAIPLGDDSVDVAFVAQAFHWFDAPRALEEIHRVLVPGGGLGLIWNERDESVEWVAELSRAMLWDVKQPYKVGTDFSQLVKDGPFDDVERVKFQHSQTLTRQGLYQRVMTTSYISAMEAAPRVALMRRVAVVVEQLPEPIVLPYVTDVYSARAAKE